MYSGQLSFHCYWQLEFVSDSDTVHCARAHASAENGLQSPCLSLECAPELMPQLRMGSRNKLKLLEAVELHSENATKMPAAFPLNAGLAQSDFIHKCGQRRPRYSFLFTIILAIKNQAFHSNLALSALARHYLTSTHRFAIALQNHRTGSFVNDLSDH